VENMEGNTEELKVPGRACREDLEKQPTSELRMQQRFVQYPQGSWKQYNTTCTACTARNRIPRQMDKRPKCAAPETRGQSDKGCHRSKKEDTRGTSAPRGGFVQLMQEGGGEGSTWLIGGKERFWWPHGPWLDSGLLGTWPVKSGMMYVQVWKGKRCEKKYYSLGVGKCGEAVCGL